MKRSVNNLKSSQPEMLSKRAEKKRVNLPWNHRLFFQIGLIVSLLTVFFIMESSFQVKKIQHAPKDISRLDEPFRFHEFTIEEPKVIKPIEKKVLVKPTALIAKPITTVVMVSPDDSNLDETKTTPTSDPVVSDPTIIEKPDNEGDMKPKNMLSVEFVPVFPGCESLVTNEEKIACMSSKIGNFVQRTFRADKFNYLDKDNTHKVYVNFKIDSNGDIVDVKARASNNELEEEGRRVIEKLPKMKPGKQGDKVVDVLYTVPILFRVD